jgi:hypothetical protein
LSKQFSFLVCCQSERIQEPRGRIRSGLDMEKRCSQECRVTRLAANGLTPPPRPDRLRFESEMDGMRKNIIPAIIAFAPAVLLPLIQDAVRPIMSHTGLLGFVLSWAPDFVVGFCFPFSILIRPRAWTLRVAANLFSIWSVFTGLVLILVECLSPFGTNVFDPADIAAGVSGVALALVVFHTVIRARLTFGDDHRALGAEQSRRE